jgi:DnaJ-class molecular chaperone
MFELYRVLNVPRTADQATIKRAYHKLAKELHPDRNPGDGAAERRFKEITQAYRLLSDPAMRARYDRGEIDASGNPRRPFGFGGFQPAGAGAFRSAAENVFDRVFGGGFGRAGTRPPFEDLHRQSPGGRPTGQASRGADRRYRLEVDFLTAARGGKRRLRLSDGRSIELEVPRGTEDGAVLRLKGQGLAGSVAAGDALVIVAVLPHPHLERRGADVHLELPISLTEALLGARPLVPTIDGPVRITVPAGANSGRTLRLKGKGVVQPSGRRGDQYVRLMVVLPDPIDPELTELIAQWAGEHAYDVRPDFERE